MQVDIRCENSRVCVCVSGTDMFTVAEMWTWYCHQVFAVISSLVFTGLFVRWQCGERRPSDLKLTRGGAQKHHDDTHTRFHKDTLRISESSRTRVEDEDQCYRALLNRSIPGHYTQHALRFILSLGHLTFDLWWCSRSRSLRRTWVLLSSTTNSSSRLSGSRRSSIRARRERLKKAGWGGALSLSKITVRY